MAKIKKNPSFSIRAFARQLDIQSSALSQILRGTRPLTDKMCERLALKLELAPIEKNKLMGKTAESDGEKNKTFEYAKIQTEIFKVIADWYHYAILEMTHLSHFKGDAKWIAKTLGISVFEANVAIDRLIKLEFLEITDNGKWVDRLGDANNIGNESTAPALKKMQRQLLVKAIEAMTDVPYEIRCQSSMTIPAAKRKIPEAKKKILRFINELSEFLRDDEHRDDVYNLGVSLFPVTRNYLNDLAPEKQMGLSPSNEEMKK